MNRWRVVVSLILVFVAGALTSPSLRGLVSVRRGIGVVVAAAVLLAVLGLWRSVVPRGAGRGPLLLLGLAAGVVAWQTDASARVHGAIWPAALVVGALVVALAGVPARVHVDGGPTKLHCWLWTARPALWSGQLARRLSATVVAGSATLDLTTATLANETDLNVTIVASRLTVLVPPTWHLVPVGPIAGWWVKVEVDGSEGNCTPGALLKIHVLGAGGVVVFRRLTA